MGSDAYLEFRPGSSFVATLLKPCSGIGHLQGSSTSLSMVSSPSKIAHSSIEAERGIAASRRFDEK